MKKTLIAVTGFVATILLGIMILITEWEWLDAAQRKFGPNPGDALTWLGAVVLAFIVAGIIGFLFWDWWKKTDS
ncbi:MAG TPA: hypothetical protein VF829_02540 [Candidatus Paceibacterota bacterium]